MKATKAKQYFGRIENVLTNVRTLLNVETLVCLSTNPMNEGICNKTFLAIRDKQMSLRYF